MNNSHGTPGGAPAPRSETGAAEPVVRIRGLEKTFVTVNDRRTVERLTIIRGLDWDVEGGKRLAVIGESGSGKSTLLNIIAGLDAPTAGSVCAGGENIASLEEAELARYRSRFLGLVFQFHYLLQDFSALENVYLPAFMAGESKKSAAARAKDCLEAVGMAHRMDHMPSELSGGERQRVSVARALINRPRLILADEPTGNLDPRNAAMIGGLLFSVAAEFRTTLILVTHDASLASQADARYRLTGGRLEAA